MTNHKISVSEALRKLEAGESVSGYSIDFDRIKIEALDVMKLSKGGIIVPESAIYYDDDDIAYDEDFEGEWVRVDPANKSKTEVRITLQDDIKQLVATRCFGGKKAIFSSLIVEFFAEYARFRLQNLP